MAELVMAVTALHHRHSLALDEEASHWNKLLATPSAVNHAVALGWFPLGADGRLVVAPAEVNDTFLNLASVPVAAAAQSTKSNGDAMVCNRSPSTAASKRRPSVSSRRASGRLDHRAR